MLKLLYSPSHFRKPCRYIDHYRKCHIPYHKGGFHVTSSPPCWWTVNKRLLISSFCLSTSICSFHHCYLCLPRLHENHLYSLLVTSKLCISIVFSLSWALKWPKDKLKTMLMQNFGVTNKDYYGMLCHFL